MISGYEFELYIWCRGYLKIKILKKKKRERENEREKCPVFEPTIFWKSILSCKRDRA